jgi:Regulated-SNARE-like domain
MITHLSQCERELVRFMLPRFMLPLLCLPLLPNRYDDYMFYYIVNDGVTYLCMGDDAKSTRLPFTFLKDIQVCQII